MLFLPVIVILKIKKPLESGLQRVMLQKARKQSFP
jgi:hypothetical protein